MDLQQLKYPIGTFQFPTQATNQEIKNWIGSIRDFPGLLKAEVADLTTEQLEWKYRPDGWCIRQVVHHCADSHLNSQARFKLALTEDTPTIKPYLEDKWAELSDMQTPIDWSLTLLEGLHKRWIILLENLQPEELERTYFHPEHQKTFTVMQTIAQYAWHCDHHLAHIRQAKEAKGSY